MVDPHRLAELRSLAYHRAVAERLDDEVLSKARAFVERELGKGTRACDYLRRWQRLLDGSTEALVRAMTTDDEVSRALRSATPFAGALDPRERWRLWAEVKRAAS